MRRRWLFQALGAGLFPALAGRGPAARATTASTVPPQPPPAGAPAASPRAPSAPVEYPPVLPGGSLTFPRDFGAHPDWRTEWWYLTGWLDAGGRAVGVQVTFFRSRTRHDDANPSRFAPRQLLLAHAAVAIEGRTRLRHAQRAARAGFGLVRFSTEDTDLAIGDWSLRRTPDDRYLATIPADGFRLDLEFRPHAPPFPQGDDGYSRKGPRPEQASRYYSRPQLDVRGSARLGAPADGDALPARGKAWLDHEWSSELLDASAVGWDWVGLNLHDGSALMAFRIRRREGGVLWSHARWIPSAAPAPAPEFEPLRQWRSARSGARYPVEMLLTVGNRRLRLVPMFDDQELDTRASTGTIYWEGAMRVLENGREVGRGYLELTGYAGEIRL